MIENKIGVLFFSKTPNLSRTIGSIFSHEIDFTFKDFACLHDLYSFECNHHDTIAVLDLSNSVSDFLVVLSQYHAELESLVTIFLVENEEILTPIREQNFTSYDLMLKPFLVNDLIDKIRSSIKYIRQFYESPIILRGNLFSPRTGEIRNSRGVSIRLTEKETEIINFLYREQGNVLSKDILLKTIWGYSEKISTHTLETHIYRLRKKIQIGLGEKKLILKNRGGYYLNP